MKLFTINPFYTSLFSVIVFAALVNSFALFTVNGKKYYVNTKYKNVYGGKKTLSADGFSISGLKIYRKLNGNEQLKVQEMKKKKDERDKAREREEKLREAEDIKLDLERQKQQKIGKKTEKCNNKDVKGNEEKKQNVKRKEYNVKPKVPISRKKSTPINTQKSFRSRGAGSIMLSQ